MARERDKAGERVEVISNGPIPEVNLGAAAGARAPQRVDAVRGPGGVSVQTAPIMGVGGELGEELPQRIEMGVTAPVIGDVSGPEYPEGAQPDQIKKIRQFQVLNPGGKHVQDPHGGGRVHLHEGKIVSTQHYAVAALKQQGVRLREVTDMSPDELLDAG